MGFNESTHAFIAARYFRRMQAAFGERAEPAFIHAVQYYAHQRGRRHDQHTETGAAERGPNSGQAAVQIKEHPPAVGPHNAQRRSGRHSQPPAQRRAARRGQPGPEALFVRRRHRMYCPTL